MDPAWKTALSAEFDKPYFQKLLAFVQAEREKATVYPPAGRVFTAFTVTPLDSVRVLILGQDPYHGERQAHGLSFSVPKDVITPPSLQNIYKELRSDLGLPISLHGNLTEWAKQGVFLLNAVLTVRAHEPASHQGQGWETFTDAVIKLLSARDKPLVFVLWGRYARDKASLIDRTRHTIIESAHPSPMSAMSGFFGSKPFSKVNAALQGYGQEPIDWRLTP